MKAIQYVDESSAFTIEDYHRARVLIGQSKPVSGVACFEIPGEWLSKALVEYNHHTQQTQEKEDGQRSKTRCT